ncbi:MAG: chaperone NapD [Bacteroidota bacterium]
MFIASMIVKTAPERAEEAVLSLNRIPHVSTHGIYKESNIIVVAEADRVEDLTDLSRYILNEFEGVLGVFPTFLSSDQAIQETSPQSSTMP